MEIPEKCPKCGEATEENLIAVMHDTVLRDAWIEEDSSELTVSTYEDRAQHEDTDVVEVKCASCAHHLSDFSPTKDLWTFAF